MEIKFELEELLEMQLRHSMMDEDMKEVNELVYASDLAIGHADVVSKEINTLSSNIDTMNEVSIGKSLAIIDSSLSEISLESIDLESLSSMSLSDSVRSDLESISSKLRKAWEAIKRFFKVIWTKIRQITINMLVWFVDASRKAKKLEEILKKSKGTATEVNIDELKESISKPLYTVLSLMGMSDITFTPNALSKQIERFTYGVTEFDEPSEIDSMVLNLLVNNPELRRLARLPRNPFIKVTRIDSSKLHFSVFDMSTAQKYVSYSTLDLLVSIEGNTASSSSLDSMANEIVNNGISFATDLLAVTDKFILSKAKGIKESLFDEMDYVDNVVSSDIAVGRQMALDYVGPLHKAWMALFIGVVSDEEFISLARGMSTFITKTSKDVIFGLNGLARDILEIGVITARLYQTNDKNSKELAKISDTAEQGTDKLEDRVDI